MQCVHVKISLLLLCTVQSPVARLFGSYDDFGKNILKNTLERMVNDYPE